MKKRRGRPRKASRGHHEPGRRNPQGQSLDHGRSRPEPGRRGLPEMFEKLWVPWSGLVVIGKRMELLGRNTQKPKLEADDWRLEGVERAALREKPGLTQGGTPLLSSALQGAAGLRRDSSQEKGERPEVRHRTGAESESSGPLAGPKKGYKAKERLRVVEAVEFGGEDLRARVFRIKQEEEMLRPNGKKLSMRLRLSGEKLSVGEDKLMLSGEKLRSSGEKQNKSEDKPRLSGEKLRLSGDKLVASRGKRPTSGEMVTAPVETQEPGGESGGETREPRGERRLSWEERQESKGLRRERRASLAEKVLLKGDSRGSKVGKLGLRVEKRASTEEKGGSSDERRRLRIGSVDEQVERVVEFTRDEKFVDADDNDTEILAERTEKDEPGGVADAGKAEEVAEVKEEEVGAEAEGLRSEEGLEAEEGALHGGKDAPGESASVEEREAMDEGPGD